MLNNGTVFDESMGEAYNKQKGFVGSIVSFDVKLVSKVVNDCVSELTFHYKMVGEDCSVMEFTGKHIQTWDNKKIVREEYFTV